MLFRSSARSVLDGLDSAGHEVVTVSIGREGTWQLGGSGSHALGSDPQTRPLETRAGSVQGEPGFAETDQTASSGHGQGPGPEAGPAETLPVPAASASVTQTLAAVDVAIPILHEIGRASVGKECEVPCRSRWSPYH